MKICHVVPSGGWYGTETVAAEMANHLRRRGHQVALVWRPGHGFGPGAARSALDDGVDLCVVPPDLRGYDAQARYCLRELSWTPDVYHAHLGPGARLAGALSGGRTPWVGSLHIRFFASQFGESDAVVGVSPWQLEDVPPSYRGQRFLVSNFLPRLESPPERVLRTLRQRLFADDDTFVVGSVGRLNIEKGFDVLCRAFIEAELPNARLVIIGEGGERGPLMRYAESCPDILLTGYLENAYRYMPGFDVYASTSRAESFGMSLLEAMSFGVPVISSTALGPSDLLRDQPHRLVPIGDVAATRDALRRAYEVREKRATYDLSRFAPELAIARLEEAYEQTVATFEPRKTPPKRWSSRVDQALRRVAAIGRSPGRPRRSGS